MLRNDELAPAMKEIKMAKEIDKVDLSLTERAEIALIHDYELTGCANRQSGQISVICVFY